MLESKFQRNLIDKLNLMFPGCIIMKTDSGYIQGIPDLLILYKKKWAALEVKRKTSAKTQPNQQYYIDAMNKMSFAALIHPDNESEVLYEIQRALGTTKQTRVPKRK